MRRARTDTYDLYLAYARGLTVREVGVAYGLSGARVAKRLADAGYVRRHRGARVGREQHARALRWVEARQAQYERLMQEVRAFAKEFGVEL
jgi:hypothetical protein